TYLLPWNWLSVNESTMWPFTTAFALKSGACLPTKTAIVFSLQLVCCVVAGFETTHHEAAGSQRKLLTKERNFPISDPPDSLTLQILRAFVKYIVPILVI